MPHGILISQQSIIIATTVYYLLITSSLEEVAEAALQLFERPPQWTLLSRHHDI